jgi:hypothetical protein
MRWKRESTHNCVVHPCLRILLTKVFLCALLCAVWQLCALLKRA